MRYVPRKTNINIRGNILTIQKETQNPKSSTVFKRKTSEGP